LPSSEQEFQIPDGKYTIETFHECVIKNRDNLFSQGKKYKWVKIHAVRTLEKMLELKLLKYRQRDLGDFWHVRIPDFSNESSRKTDFYVTRYSPKLLLFYSSSTGKEYSNTLDYFVKTTSGFGKMWIGPRLYEELLFNIMDKFSPTMRWFRANRAEDDNFPEKTKRDVTRKVYWRARDSYETLLELRGTYGIRPTSVALRMKGGEIQFTNDGLFTVRSQTKEMFNAFDFALGYIKDKEAKLTGTAQQLKKDFETIKSETGKMKIPVLTSGKIRLNSKKLDSSTVKDFMAIHKRFEFADSRKQEKDSFHWIATAMDREKESIFGISSNESEIALIPHTQECTFESFLDFYRQILEEVDDTATLNTFGA